MRLGKSKAADAYKRKQTSPEQENERKIWAIVDEYKTLGLELERKSSLMHSPSY